MTEKASSFNEKGKFTFIVKKDANKIDINYELMYNSEDTKCVIIKATAHLGDKMIQTFGEAAPMNNQNAYPVAMAEKRAMSRAVLSLLDFMSMVYFQKMRLMTLKDLTNE